MNWLLGILLSQYMVSATAGLVCQVRGSVNVTMGTIVAAGKSVETGPHGLVELQLHPGSYLRLRENSSAAFDSTILANIVLHLTSGFALIDTSDADPPFPITITAGSTTVAIRRAGIYGFSPDSIKVFDGRLELDDGTVVRKGYETSSEIANRKLIKLSKKEVQQPYAADKLKVFIASEKDSDRHIQEMNSFFADVCRRSFVDLRDASTRLRRDTRAKRIGVMTVRVSRKSGDYGMRAEVELKKADGSVVFSNMSDDSDSPGRNIVSSGDILISGGYFAVNLIGDILNRTGWR